MTSADFSKTLPFSMEAERGVICSMLLDPQNVIALMTERGVTHNHFHLPAHQELYSAMIGMWASEVPIDFITLTETFKRRGTLEQVGGAAFITGIFTELPTAANVETYQKIICADHTLREVIKTCAEAAKESYDRETEPEQIISRLSE